MTTKAHFAPWDEREWPRLLSAEEGARRASCFAELEDRQASMLDDFAANAGSPHMQATLRRHAGNARWHAHVWRQHISDGSPAPGSTLDDRVKELLDTIASSKAAEEAIEFLTGVYRVLIPRKVAAYTYYQRAIGTHATDADWRWIDFMMKDELDAVRDGELTLQTLMQTEGDAERSARRRAALERTVVAAGGLVGPDTLGLETQKGPRA